MFQCRTRLCGWCNGKRQIAPWSRRCFNAARGFVGGAASIRGREPSLKARFNAARGVVGGAADEVDRDTIRALRRFNAARGVVGGAAIHSFLKGSAVSAFQCRTRRCWWCSYGATPESFADSYVSMPHAALLVVQHRSRRKFCGGKSRFNAARGVVGGAAGQGGCGIICDRVSMPHAALLVVQHSLLSQVRHN